MRAGRHNSPASSAFFNEYCCDARAEKGRKDSRLAAASLDHPRIECEFEKPALTCGSSVASNDRTRAEFRTIMMQGFDSATCSCGKANNCKEWQLRFNTLRTFARQRLLCDYYSNLHTVGRITQRNSRIHGCL